MTLRTRATLVPAINFGQAISWLMIMVGVFAG
jgi:Zn-dependent membrane protease YugP